MKIKYLLVLVLSNLVLFHALSFAQESKNSKDDEPKRNVVRLLKFENPNLMLQILPGKWVFSDMTCDNPYVIEVSPDKEKIKFTVNLTEEEKEKGEQGETRSFVYDVLEITSFYIRTEIQGEERKTDNGKIVQWDFVFASKNRFFWHRTDWRPGGLTPPVTRCLERDKRAVGD